MTTQSPTQKIIYLKPVDDKYWPQGDAWAFKISFASFITDNEILAETISSYYRAEIVSKYSAIVSVSKNEVKMLDENLNLIIDINPDFNNVYMSWLELISDLETSIDLHNNKYVHIDELVCGELYSRMVVINNLEERPHVLHVSESGCFNFYFFLDEEGDYASDGFTTLADLVSNFWDYLVDCKVITESAVGVTTDLDDLVTGWSEAVEQAYEWQTNPLTVQLRKNVAVAAA